MDTTLIFTPPPPRINRPRIVVMHNRVRSSHIVSAVTVTSGDASSSPNLESKNAYRDNWFERLAISHLSNSLQDSTGLKSAEGGYEGLIEAARMAARSLTPVEQREVVLQTLSSAFPKHVLTLIKTLLPPSKFAREYFAAFTTIFFAWLVGPCVVKEWEFEGKMERNVVHIPKCRFLEGTNCVGMCTNLCKMPSQAFIKESLGMPINMVPNFEDMSCDMIFGQEPPSESNDPAFAQPCYKLCKEIKKPHKSCTS